MASSSSRASKCAGALILALVLPILAACGGSATTPTTSTPAAPSAAASVAAPSVEASTEAPSAEATPAADTGDTAAESPINDKVFIAAMNQAPDTLFDAESQSSATSQVTVALGSCMDTLQYDYQTTYCYDEFPTLENGGAVTETVQIDAASISPENPIVVGGELITDTTVAEAAGLEIPSELPQLSLTFKLNPDLKWEDGTPVTSQDVVETLRVLKDPETQVATRRLFDRTVRIDTPDDQTAVQVMAPGFIENEYWTWFIGNKQNGTPLLPAHIIEGMSISEIRDAFSTKPLSYGPYMLSEYEPGSQATLVSNPYFPTQPKIGTVIWKFVTDQEQLLAQIETGDIDYAGTIGLTLAQNEQLSDLESQGVLTAQFVPATVWEHIDFGIERGDGQPSFFEDVTVRQAVAYGINRQEIIDSVLFGRTTTMNTYVPSEHPSYPGDDQLEAYDYDPERAKQLLEEAGWVDSDGDGIREKDGRPFSLTYYTTQGNSTRQAVSEIIQQNLREIGIDLTLEFVPGTEVLFKNGADGILAGRRFDMAMYAWVSGTSPSHNLYRCDQIPTPENNYAGQNNPGYCNPEFDEAAQAAFNELDQSAARELDKVAETIYNRDLPSFPLYQRVNVGAHKPTVTGIKLDPTSYFDLYNIQEIDIEQ